MARVNVDIPYALKAQVDQRRAVEKRSLKAVVEIALERYLAEGRPEKAEADHAA